jgi:hypothetical protein
LVARLREKAVDGFGQLRADAGDRLERWAAGLPHGIEATEAVGEVAGHGRADLRDSQPVEEAS